MKKNVLIIGAGGVAQVVAHKCAQNNDVLGDIGIASRTVAKCEAISASVAGEGEHEGGRRADVGATRSTRSTSPPPSA